MDVYDVTFQALYLFNKLFLGAGVVIAVLALLMMFGGFKKENDAVIVMSLLVLLLGGFFIGKSLYDVGRMKSHAQSITTAITTPGAKVSDNFIYVVVSNDAVEGVQGSTERVVQIPALMNLLLKARLNEAGLKTSLNP